MKAFILVVFILSIIRALIAAIELYCYEKPHYIIGMLVNIGFAIWAGCLIF